MRALRNAATIGCVAGSLAVTGCARPAIPEFPQIEVVPPTAGAIDAAVFLIGDNGDNEGDRSPIMRRLRDDIEFWAGAIGRDSAVTVVFLGDNVYPVGVRDQDHSAFARDSTRLWDQIELLAGENATRRKAGGLFLAGNHDWGNQTGLSGIRRLTNMEEQLDLAREGGIDVRLIPKAGEPGPSTFDVRSNARLVLMDTHWFLQERSYSTRTEFFEGVRGALDEAGQRHVIMAAHHPFASVGAHGTLTPASRALGLLYLFKKSGTLIQDLNSPIYGEFLRRLRSSFVESGRPPLVFAGGHDHSLQVIKGSGEAQPEWIVVSGAASKQTSITDSPELEFGATHLGYMLLLFHRNDAVELYVIASDNDTKTCPEEPADELEACMVEETAAFRLQYSTRIAEPTSTDTIPVTPPVRDTTIDLSMRR